MKQRSPWSKFDYAVVGLIVLIVILASVTGCGTDLRTQCIAAGTAIEVYEECMADPACGMDTYERRKLIEARTDWERYDCEERQYD